MRLAPFFEPDPLERVSGPSSAGNRPKNKYKLQLLSPIPSEGKYSNSTQHAVYSACVAGRSGLPCGRSWTRCKATLGRRTSLVGHVCWRTARGATVMSWDYGDLCNTQCMKTGVSGQLLGPKIVSKLAPNCSFVSQNCCPDY